MSLNDFFSIEGDFVKYKNGKYQLYNGSDILNKNVLERNNIIFANSFRVKLLKQPLEKSEYEFYMRLELENRSIDILIAAINLY